MSTERHLAVRMTLIGTKPVRVIRMSTYRKLRTSCQCPVCAARPVGCPVTGSRRHVGRRMAAEGPRVPRRPLRPSPWHLGPILAKSNLSPPHTRWTYRACARIPLCLVVPLCPNRPSLYLMSHLPEMRRSGGSVQLAHKFRRARSNQTFTISPRIRLSNQVLKGGELSWKK